MRHGTVLIFAISITTLLLTVVFGFVRVAQLQRQAGSASTPLILARQAATAGSQHALEQILRDYVDAGEPATRLDGPARAVFRPIIFPGLRDRNQIDPRLSDSRLIGINDSTTEDLILNCGLGYGWSYDRGGYAYGTFDPANPAVSSWDGRARWYEVEMANPAVAATPAIPASGEPTTGVVRFSDADGEAMDSRNGNANDATTLTPPSRCAPIMYDANWRRLTASTPAQAVALRQTARYRLRYAVGVRDLEGSLLVNADPNLDWRAMTGDPRPDTYSDLEVQRLVRAWHAFPNIVNLMAHSSSNTSGRIGAGVRAAHVLAGRGSSANYARWSDADPWPRTFPLMYRGSYVANEMWNHLASNPQNLGVSFIDLASPDTNRGPWTALFANSTGGATGAITAVDAASGAALGREQIADSGPSTAWRHVLSGPQFSPFNLSMALTGGQSLLEGSSDTVFDEAMLGLTPFGAGVRKSGSGDPTPDTPWSVNTLTATHNVLQGMVLGTLPAGVLQVRYVLRAAGPPYDSSHRVSGSNSKEYWGVFRTRNLWVKTQAAAFSRYEPPARHVGDDPTKAVLLAPDYHVLADRPGSDFAAHPELAEQGFIHPTLRYPGPVAWNVTENNQHTGKPASYHDDLGKDIDVSDQPLIRDVHFQSATFGDDDDKYAIAATVSRGTLTAQSLIDPFVADQPTDAGWSAKDSASDPNPASGGKDSLWDRMKCDYDRFDIQVHTDSFYRDIVYAFSNAVAMARMANCRLPVGTYTPSSSDLAHSGALATRPTTAAELDALFLRCLGIDIGNPASAPVSGYCGDSSNKPVTFTPAYNIYTLASRPAFTRDVVLVLGDAATTVPAGLLTQVMERMLNDFRLSLLGSHPSYAATFRPLDFNGDGRVACSGYPANALHGAATAEYKCHVEQDQAAGASGQGPIVSQPFCQAGNLMMGRSRFWDVWVRGEVFDNLSKRALSQVTLQTVYVVDPLLSGTASKHQATHAIYQRWYFNMTKGMAAGAY